MLDLSLLENVKQRGGKTIAVCPACRANGGDKKGNHLWINSTDGSGEYGCAAFQGDNLHRKEIFSLVGIKEPYREFTPEEKREWGRRQREREQVAMRAASQAMHKRTITQQIESILEHKLAPYQSGEWMADLYDSSPIRFDDPERANHDFIQGLFMPDDILWLGEVFDTGNDYNADNFMPCREWLELPLLPPRIAAGTFKAGSISRCKNNVTSSPYIILESDDLIGHKPVSEQDKARNKALSYALIAYAQDKLGLTLRAVIDTGNKSLHAWFDRPSQAELTTLWKMQQGLRLDDSVLEGCAHSPMRLHGTIHDKTRKPASLLYLNPKH